MQSNIFELIDLLVDMSGSKSNLDELKADLNNTVIEIDEKKEKLNTLEQEMSDDNYFDASNEIVDRNIKISITKKLQKLKKIKADIDKELEENKKEEERLHYELEKVSEDINDFYGYNEVINEIDNPTDSYKNMLKIEEERFNKMKDIKQDLESKYEVIQKKVEYLAISSNEMTDKIAKENERLIEIDNNLSNIKSYVDTDAKEEDEQRYLDLKAKLDELENHKNSILEDPVYIAGIIKESIANENKSGVDKEFTHLVDKVKEVPYMELENEDIQVEMQKLNNELTAYDNEISQKEYQTLDGEFIDERLSYLDESIKKTKEYIKDLKDRIKLIENDNELLSSKIYRAEKQIESIDKSIADYENYDYGENDIPKAVVQAAYNKLVEEKENIFNISENYRGDLILNLNELKDTKELIKLYENEVQVKDDEYDELNKKLSLNTTSKNILEEEKDRIALEKINKKIIDLKNREKYTKSISKILEEFEMLNSSLEFVDRKARVIRKTANIDEVTPIDEIISDEKEDFKEEASDAENKEELDEIKPIDESKDDEVKQEKLRVVEVTPISDDVSEKEEEQSYLLNDFQDDDYEDIDKVMSDMEEE